MSQRMLKRFVICDRLASITRYSRDFMVKRESVLEHIGFAALYSLILCRELQRDGVEIDIGKVLEKATIHDIDESVFGDVPRVTKYFSPEISAAFKKVEAEGVQQLFHNLNLDEMAEDWEFAKGSSLEGQVVALVDLAAVVYKVWFEIALSGNLSFLRVYRELQGFVAEKMTAMAAQKETNPLLPHMVDMNQLMQYMKKYDTLDKHVNPEGML